VWEERAEQKRRQKEQERRKRGATEAKMKKWKRMIQKIAIGQGWKQKGSSELERGGWEGSGRCRWKQKEGRK
jgi:hypothetical protein